MEYNKKSAMRWSAIGERPTFGLTLFEAAKNDNNIIALVADVTNSAGLGNMQKELPDQVINIGIAEQNMMGIATGLSSEGYTVFTTTFAPFQAMRCLEQIRVNQGYMNQKVIMVGLASGVAYGELGCTHCSLEDVAVLRSIPNISIVVPADCMEVAKAVEAAIHYNSSVYIRLMDKTNVPKVYLEDYPFEIDKATPLIEEGEIAILANGPMVYQSLEAAKKYFEDTNQKIAVFDMHTIKPLDTDLLKELPNKFSAILTIEEHYMVGGLGSAVAEYYADKKYKIPIYRMGFPDVFPHGASHEKLLEVNQLDKEGIYKKISDVLEDLS